MGQQKRVFPAELELKILKILWREGPLRVREVRKNLADEGRELAHTTVVTTLNKMVAKGFAESTQELNAYIFEAALNKKASVSFGNLPKMKCSHLCPWLGRAGGSHGHW